ncbi:hypothetical membrane protein [Salmonella phage PVPSE1]|uniref:Hypothetical membrane protein n=1 Tax=Salmonella phage PVPSE1 TaxID=889338 RepID=G3BM56_9CAUD|nr:hypothetical membrane protein [Salmonella phage PVPSE1]ADP02586.1 hypothetical membrane protein [Salmonella phage PVPSE1]
MPPQTRVNKMLDYTNSWCVVAQVSFLVAMLAVVAIYIILEDN